ncbi:conserved Plasmodium protein, unknown function [Plasmodium berghei]|uniref:Uncharacterized protein n=1 Tax=Plasmodium berghei TaxID=5821 RepID=A0A1C6YU36_PLABE|nr:conserved Plasmodium protein, unknown function [Plasmodium berghei]SCN28706.1 conserved Plasmodium protein, unknown function [Plasmodium berghei]SCO62948.1 conserved Plasmodium protein, unknown function [Plasmodium berghei]SCO64453.1 conserved Plasmodium protein, unknown function [Plasmodium berghei]
MSTGLGRLLEIGIFVGSFVLIWYLTGEKLFKRKRKIVKDNILLILRHLCFEIYKVLNESSKTTKQVYDMIKSDPNAAIDVSKLEEAILNQGYKKKIEDVEKQVLDKFNVTADDFYDELKNYDKDADVQKSLNSIKKMYNESLLGFAPKLPSIDENISKDVIINLTNLIYKEKRKIYKDKIDSMIKKNEDFDADVTFSDPEFFDKLQKSTEHVEEQIINENSDIIPNLFTFKYLVNYYSNDITFVQKKKYLESKHGEKMIKILKIKKNKKQKKKSNKDSSSSLHTQSQRSLPDHINSDKNEYTINYEDEKKSEYSKSLNSVHAYDNINKNIFDTNVEPTNFADQTSVEIKKNEHDINAEASEKIWGRTLNEIKPDNDQSISFNSIPEQYINNIDDFSVNKEIDQDQQDSDITTNDNALEPKIIESEENPEQSEKPHESDTPSEPDVEVEAPVEPAESKIAVESEAEIESEVPAEPEATIDAEVAVAVEAEAAAIEAEVPAEESEVAVAVEAATIDAEVAVAVEAAAIEAEVPAEESEVAVAVEAAAIEAEVPVEEVEAEVPAEEVEAEVPAEEVEAEVPVEEVEAEVPVEEVEAEVPVEEVEAEVPVEEVEAEVPIEQEAAIEAETEDGKQNSNDAEVASVENKASENREANDKYSNTIQEVETATNSEAGTEKSYETKGSEAKKKKRTLGFLKNIQKKNKAEKE